MRCRQRRGSATTCGPRLQPTHRAAPERTRPAERHTFRREASAEPSAKTRSEAQTPRPPTKSRTSSLPKEPPTPTMVIGGAPAMNRKDVRVIEPFILTRAAGCQCCGDTAPDPLSSAIPTRRTPSHTVARGIRRRLSDQPVREETRKKCDLVIRRAAAAFQAPSQPRHRIRQRMRRWLMRQ